VICESGGEGKKEGGGERSSKRGERVEREKRSNQTAGGGWTEKGQVGESNPVGKTT